MAVRKINVKAHPNVEEGHVAFWDVDPEYPNGEVFVAADGHVVEAATTTRLNEAIAQRRLVETDEAPTRPALGQQDPNQLIQEPLPAQSRTPNPLSTPEGRLATGSLDFPNQGTSGDSGSVIQRQGVTLDERGNPIPDGTPAEPGTTLLSSDVTPATTDATTDTSSKKK